jgi:hypothetical protein
MSTTEKGVILMVPGLFGSRILFAVGAVLDFAVTANQFQHGFNVRTIGLILMIVGAVGVVFSVAFGAMGGGWRRHRTVIDDGQGNVVRRDDTYV